MGRDLILNDDKTRTDRFSCRGGGASQSRVNIRAVPSLIG